ncbi:MAG TPA: glutamate synthase large subunit [Terracidiphilus sp.]|jgi:glutamate synthase domain-containing protein 2/glutamate synthase domain-containing protein 1/glutamate synthase domain-containing protein 3|nr:glutamate synthase large subunit [Terracidiphilus sp.]
MGILKRSSPTPISAPADARAERAALPAHLRESLVDPRFDIDSCGVGFVARLSAEPSHAILQKALTALARLAHRGAVAADGKSSDGVGVTTTVPRDWLLAQTGITLLECKPLGVAVVFLPADAATQKIELEAALAAQEIEALHWRPVPVRPEVLGESADAMRPDIWQLLCTSDDPVAFDRRLFLARKQFERAGLGGYIASISSATIVYKALCAGRLLSDFYPDLADPEFKTPLALFHQRYATNVLPTWDRAQPFRTLAHNGEINTIWGNRANMEARAATMSLDLHPVLSTGGSDSTSLDEIVELLANNGRTVGEAVRMMLPPANPGDSSAFLQYCGDCIEPWDGPAALAFTDGHQVGAILDRNGLRPCRFALDDSGLVVAGSEAGLVDMDPEHIIHSGRLGPGQMIVADLDFHEFFENDEILRIYDAKRHYQDLIQLDTPLEDSSDPLPSPDPVELNRLQRRFGYTREDVRMILQPMAVEGKDAVWSMGDDTAVAPLARAPRPLYAFFRQRFAQVTNPPIDPLRESVVLKMHTRLGPWPHLLETREPLPGLSLRSPILTLGQVHALRHGHHGQAENMPHAVLTCLYAPDTTLEVAIDILAQRAVELVATGASLLIITDRGASPEALPIPMAMATGAVHMALTRAGVRAEVGLAVDAGDCREIHHIAVLLGLGAGAVCPWLALETARSLDPAKGEENLLHALELGLAKVMSKMGISVLDSYNAAHLFDAIGIAQNVVDKCFTGVPAPIAGFGYAEIEAYVRHLWLGDDTPDEPSEGEGAVISAAKVQELPDYGFIRFRKADVSESHAWQPQTVRSLQTVVGSTKQGAALALTPFSAFASQAVEAEPTNLRDLLEIRPAGPELAVESVAPASDITGNFIASAMSFGSLSPEAHQTITQAMNLLGARSNTGEGGEDPAVYAPLDGAPSLLNNKIKQVASARFGVTAEYLAHAEELEIKVAQGAKPGEGGQLPGHKVTELIARLRHAQPGMQLISPPPHHDIYSIEDLAQLIYDLKRVNPRAAVGVKLVSGCGVGTIAAGVAKAYADYIVIAGHSGGTGASPLSSIKYAGNPWELGLAEAQQVLIHNGLRGRVRLRTDGGLRTARDIVMAALLGADEFAFGTAVLVALGCDMARQCHLNTCPTGIATQRPELRAKFRGKPEHVVRFFDELAAEIRQLLATLGLPSLAAATGRTDLLEQVRWDGGLDLKPLLAATAIAPKTGGPARWMGGRNDRPEEHPPLDNAWVQPALEAFKTGQPYRLDSRVTNADRTLGARLSGELALFKTQNPTAAGSNLSFSLKGTAGQSFGAFVSSGITLQLEGLANDFVGKGLCGGELILKSIGRAALESEKHTLLGNVALYGATSGWLFAAGRAGERFAVRNSGALAIVEGVGDHACEYMTGGLAVILGSTGINFGAGMTGGLAWIYDEDGSFLARTQFHQSFLQPESWADLDHAARQSIRELVELHAAKTASTRARWLLSHWEKEAEKFVRMTPRPQA